MKNATRSKSAVFLIEFLITLAVFSLACVVTLRIFAGADALQKQSADTDCAAAIATTVSEQLMQNGATAQQLSRYCGGALKASNGYVLYFDAECSVCSRANAVYMALFTAKQTFGAGTLLEAEVTVYEMFDCEADESTNQLYTLSSARYYPRTEANG